MVRGKSGKLKLNSIQGQGISQSLFEVSITLGNFLEVAANYFIRCFRIDKAIF